MNRRAGAAAAILLAWVSGLGLLARRESTRTPADRLARAALNVGPGASYYAVDQGDTQIGFASSTIDTTTAGFVVTDYFVADLPLGGALHRASARSVVFVNRKLALDSFTVAVRSEGGAIDVSGHPESDTLLAYTLRADGAKAEVQHVRTSGPVLFPTLVPLVVALGDPPRVGRTLTVSMFDPTAMAPRDLHMTIRAESLFVVADSAKLDAATHRYVTASSDTVRAWRISSDAQGGFTGWVDAQGHLVELAQPGNLTMRRGAYELVFSNWRREMRDGPARAKDRDIVEGTAIAASVPLGGRPVRLLRATLGGVDLTGYELAGSRQAWAPPMLTVTREAAPAMRAPFNLPYPDSVRARFAAELAPEPLLQSDSPEIRALATRLAAENNNPNFVGSRIAAWVHDSLRKEYTFGVPNAMQVLQSRSGDCNEHTQLYLALARAAGIPARSAAGLVYVRGKFYYHAWPEIWLGDWVAVDPTFGQYPADAGHLRFVTGGLDRQAALLRLIGQVTIDVAEAR